MRRFTLALFIIVSLFAVVPAGLLAQLDQLHGEFVEFRPGIHSGNQIRLTIWNDGQIGTKEARSELIPLEWPINSGYRYFGQSMIKVGTEVKDKYGDIKHIFSESNGWRPNDPTDPGSGDMGTDGEWYTFLPLPGFANSESEYLAMSHLQNTWPADWPDKQEDKVDPGWPNSWNGYFGKNIKNADQESYFVMDDYNNKEFAFYPDSLDEERRGLGMRITARGFQWSNALVEDIFFALYDVKNISTTNYTKVVFAQFVGAAIGNTVTQGGDNGDDNGSYVLEERLVYSYDDDNLGNTGWTPVGYYGCAFLESPGNPFDGIDNDFDGKNGTGKTISDAMFVPTTLTAGSSVIKIDYKTYKRTKVTLNDTLLIPHNDKVLKFWPGQIVEEIPHNLIDDNLNGLIDENNGSTFGEAGSQVTSYLYIGNKYIDYYTGEGADNPMIDEYRDDGIDNDGNWDIMLDDVGIDGVPFTGDYGEGDGKPTSGWLPPNTIAGLEGEPNQFGLIDTNLPGEPHIDKTDINESDMIGLTSFYLYTPWSLLPGYDDELIWEKTKPGYLDDRSQNSDTDFTFSSGYFPVNAGQIERYSIAHIMGADLDDMLINKQWGDRAYEQNYNFSKAPNIPTLNAVPGNNCVTLYWDTFAEKSVDPILGEDFEGYRIYRSTDPGWNDMDVITDGYGFDTFRKPLAQFDLNNEYSGYSPVPIKGVEFYLGDNTGIVNTYVDSTAKNGFTYYYAVTAYDHGDPSGNIAPSECSKYISISTSGVVEKGTNVQKVRPEAPSAGYIPANIDSMRHTGGLSTALVGYEIIDPSLILDRHTYRITFSDTLVEPTRTPDLQTTRFNLIDITNTAAPDTLIKGSTAVNPEDVIPIVNGFKLQMSNLSGITQDSVNSRWNRSSLYGMSIKPFKYSTVNGIPVGGHYRIEFDEVGYDTSVAYKAKAKNFKAQAVNYRVYDISQTPEKKVPTAFWSQDVADGDPEGKFTAFTDGSLSDRIIFLDDTLGVSWMFEMDSNTNDSLHVGPTAGDVATVRLNIPFLAADMFEFTTYGEGMDKAKAKLELDRIKVVPNPYIVANSWEPLNPYSNGRGPRELHFIHLPEKCTIRIFNIRGQLVRELEHNTPSLADGTEVWDMLTKDLLDISYGVYIYHIDAGELGEVVGKFAIVK